MLPGWVIIRKQSLIVGFALARLELSHKADIEEWNPGCAPLKYFLGRERQGEFVLRLVVFVPCQVSALVNEEMKI